MGSKPIDIDGRYKIVSEDDYIYLFPKNKTNNFPKRLILCS